MLSRLRVEQDGNVQIVLEDVVNLGLPEPTQGEAHNQPRTGCGSQHEIARQSKRVYSPGRASRAGRNTPPNKELAGGSKAARRSCDLTCQPVR